MVHFFDYTVCTCEIFETWAIQNIQITADVVRCFFHDIEISFFYYHRVLQPLEISCKPSIVTTCIASPMQFRRSCIVEIASVIVTGSGEPWSKNKPVPFNTLNYNNHGCWERGVQFFAQKSFAARSSDPLTNRVDEVESPAVLTFHELHIIRADAVDSDEYLCN